MSNLAIGKWMKGGKHGSRSLSDRRLVEDFSTGDSYYNFLIDDSIAMCDIESLHLLDTYHWIIPRGVKSVRTTLKKDGKTIAFTFSKLVLGDSDGRVMYIDGDHLNVCRSNLKLVKVKKNERMNFVADPVDKETIKNSLASGIPGEWELGKVIGGSIYKASYRGWIIRFKNPTFTKTFSFDGYGGETQCRNAVEDFRREEGIRRDLVFNRYRTISVTIPKVDKYLEVQAECKGDVLSFFCDIQDLGLVKERKWTIKQRANDSSRSVVVTPNNGSPKSFHVLLELYGVTDHIDGNPLNNRRCKFTSNVTSMKL